MVFSEEVGSIQNPLNVWVVPAGGVDHAATKVHYLIQLVLKLALGLCLGHLSYLLVKLPIVLSRRKLQAG